jgi:hypothetical protein
MLVLDPSSNLPQDRQAREILLIMYNPPRTGEDDFHLVGTPAADELNTKTPDPWTIETLFTEVSGRHDVSLNRIREVVKLLYENELIDRRGPEQGDATGYDLNESGEREAMWLGARKASA